MVPASHYSQGENCRQIGKLKQKSTNYEERTRSKKLGLLDLHGVFEISGLGI